ncbi:MAG: hypothetical protein ACXWQO_02615 [Bdellovibrionota bacterium]
MSRVLFALASMALVFLGCSASRKISSVGLREISSISSAQVVSEKRLRLSESKKFAKECPAAITEILPTLALEDVEFPACPEALVANSHAALALLKSEERTSLEEAINSQCRSLGNPTDGTSIDLVFPGSELRNLGARYPEKSTESQVLSATRDGISSLIEHHLPLDRWVHQNGGYLLSEEVVASLDKLMNEKKCKLSDEEVDVSFTTIRGLEDLSRLLTEGDQKHEVEQLLRGIYSVQDKKIEEYFRP